MLHHNSKKTNNFQVYIILLLYKVVGESHFEGDPENHMIVPNPPDVCQVVEVTTECDDQPSSMSQLYPLQISPVSSYEGKQPSGTSKMVETPIK